MAKKKVNISLPSVDELFTSQVERDSKGSSVIQLLPVASITPFPNHPFGVRDDQDMEQQWSVRINKRPQEKACG